MNIGRVVGNIVSTAKDSKLEGMKFYLLDICDANGTATGGNIVAVDTVGAGIGELVMYTCGSSARQTDFTDSTPVDAVVVGIIDTIDKEGTVLFSKTGNLV